MRLYQGEGRTYCDFQLEYNNWECDLRQKYSNPALQAKLQSTPCHLDTNWRRKQSKLSQALFRDILILYNLSGSDLNNRVTFASKLRYSKTSSVIQAGSDVRKSALAWTNYVTSVARQTTNY